MNAVLGVDGNRFLLDGRPANDGLHLRGVPLAGSLLGIDVGRVRDDDHVRPVITRASEAGLNTILFDLPTFPFGVTPGSSVDHAEPLVRMVFESGVVPFVRAANARTAWRRDRRDADPDTNDASLARHVHDVARWLASIVPSTSALVVELPPGPLNNPEVQQALIRAARDGGEDRVLIGAYPASTPAGGAMMPDFLIGRRQWRQSRRATWIEDASPGSRHDLPLICTGDGNDLDDPDGEFGSSAREGTSWFLRVNPQEQFEARLPAGRLDAFLETVRAARASGRAPSDHPTVTLADQRHAFRRHAEVVRNFGLVPADALGGAPR